MPATPTPPCRGRPNRKRVVPDIFRLDTSDADALARLHGQCFVDGWSADTFRQGLADGAVMLGVVDEGAATRKLLAFVHVKPVADEAEILTLATDPTFRKQGLARAVMDRLLAVAQAQGWSRILLDVAADNTAALALYTGLDFREDGRRAGYYTTGRETPCDAILMSWRAW